jgi:hypothetical protein
MLQRKPDVPFGSEQLIKLYVELLLVQIIRKYGGHRVPDSELSSMPKDGCGAAFSRSARFCL